ncbi:thiomuracin/GE37468 family thiazolyl RiPP peptide [Nonomuraea sp. NPDC026600]|uniref:thiomuracin/GE37468 family thiazolyl RiPP peptide n=1 Tax=Nonomuraea sp. NPDC026600 TaxID=3155363 RepID=UPI0033E73491
MSGKLNLDLEGLAVDSIEVLPADAIEFLTTGHGMTETGASIACFHCSCGGNCSGVALPLDED